VKYAGGKEYHEFSSVCWPSAVEVARKGALMVAQFFFNPVPLFEICLCLWEILNVIM
jgi:hypothetical protein